MTDASLTALIALVAVIVFLLSTQAGSCDCYITTPHAVVMIGSFVIAALSGAATLAFWLAGA